MKRFLSWCRKSGLLALIIRVLVVILFLVLLFTFVFGINYHTGNNMHPKVEDGDLVITYKLEPLNLNDVVLYKTNDGETHCGRIAAMPGDVLSISDEGEFIVNGGVRSEEIFYPTLPGKYGNSQEYKVPEDTYYILNDFRSDTSDSRSIGPVKKSDIKGNAIFVIRRRGF